jgi:uncharacterized protein (TIGR02099 family)
MPAPSSTLSRAARVLRFLATAVLVLLGGFCALLLAIRLVVYPQMDARRDDIARWLGTRIGQPVQIDGIETGWDGWNPKLTIRGFRVLDRANRSRLLELPRVDLLVAWTSLPSLDLRLKELLIEAPRLALRRDAAGRLHVGGIEREPEATADDSAFADWLMRQPQVVVLDALVAWDDDYRRAPQLLLDHVNLRLQRRFGHHHIGLTGVPPAELAAPLDLRADVTVDSLKDLSKLEGRLYMRLDYADLGAWSEWLPMPVSLESGKGALRIWIDFAKAQPVDVTADVEVEDVRARLGEGLPPLALAHLAGRTAWKRAGADTDATAKQLTFTLHDGTTLPPTDFVLKLFGTPDGAPSGGNLAFRQAELRPLAALAPHLPLPERVRQDIVRSDPRGTLANVTLEWQGRAGDAWRYALKSDFRGLALASHDGTPGVSNFAGTIDANERSGTAHVATASTEVTLPHLFADAVPLETLRGDLAWQHDGDHTELTLKDVAFANADIAGTTAGTWRSQTSGPGIFDMRAQFTRANLASAYRYLPRAAGDAMTDWLQHALVKGTSNDAQITLAGDLAQFPFAGNKGGQFVLAVKAKDATLHYADNWPVITDIAGDLRIEGWRLSIAASGGRVLGAQIGPTRVEIADMHDPKVLLQVDGTAKGPTQEFLAFIAKTPLAEWSGRVTDEATATGDGQLALKFDLPLHDRGAVSIDGRYQFASNGIRLPAAPPLNAVTGTLAFTERQVRATNLTAEAFGGPVKLQLTSDAERVRVDAAGTSDLQLVRRELDVPLLDRAHGITDWQAHIDIDARGKQAGWTIESSLAGVSVDLPPPLRKAAADRTALRVERRPPRGRDDRIAATYGSDVRVALHRQADAQHPRIDRVLVLLGKAAAESGDAEQAGVWIRGDVAAVDVDQWLAVDMPGAGAASPEGAQALLVNGVDLTAGNLDALGRRFTRLKSVARRQGGDWRLTLDGAELAGTAVWHTATAAQPNGRLDARLSRLTMPAASDAAGSSQAPEPAGAASRWPELDVVADSLKSKDRVLGKVELRAQPSGADWQIQKLALVNDAGRIDAEGWWRNAASRSQTRLTIAVDVKEAGAFLSQFGWPGAVKGAPTKIEGQLAWDGAPNSFDYPSLSGEFKLRSGAGQFTKIDPGMGRLLGVLSLQALPRRISLDFRDVFSEGFAFDVVSADVRMRNGVMHATDFRLTGPAAAVNIAGDVDIAAETVDLKVRVQPSVSTGVSAGAAALFIANPLIGAAVGAGTLLAQKMLNNPFDRLFSYDYAVTGDWDDPVVTRVPRDGATTQPANAAIR